jgi:hypothetical protein
LTKKCRLKNYLIQHQAITKQNRLAILLAVSLTEGLLFFSKGEIALCPKRVYGVLEQIIYAEL